MTKQLPKGYSVERDSDGDWVLIGPADVTIYSVPGEPVVLWDARDEAEATDMALEYLTSIPNHPNKSPMPISGNTPFPHIPQRKRKD